MVCVYLYILEAWRPVPYSESETRDLVDRAGNQQSGSDRSNCHGVTLWFRSRQLPLLLHGLLYEVFHCFLLRGFLWVYIKF